MNIALLMSRPEQLVLIDQWLIKRGWDRSLVRGPEGATMYNKYKLTHRAIVDLIGAVALEVENEVKYG
jgi:hypothetical protein